MTRSLKKGSFVDEKLLLRVQRAKKTGSREVIKTYSRASSITPEMVGQKFAVHNGRSFVEILAVEDMVGHKLGEFALTKKFVRHGGRMAREEGRLPDVRS